MNPLIRIQKTKISYIVFEKQFIFNSSVSLLKIIVQFLKNNKYRAPKTSAINPKGLMEFNFNKIQCFI